MDVYTHAIWRTASIMKRVCFGFSFFSSFYHHLFIFDLTMPIAMKRKGTSTAATNGLLNAKKPREDPDISMSDESDYTSDDSEDLLAAAQRDGDQSDTDDYIESEEEEEEEKVNEGEEEEKPVDGIPISSDGTHNGTLTNEEIQELSGMAELYKSNVFKLQIDELLKEIRIDETQTAPLKNALRKIKSILDEAPEHDGYTLEGVIQHLAPHGICIPFPTPKPGPGIMYTFAWKRPTGVHLVGSYGTRIAAIGRDGFNVDVAIEMPNELFTEKDCLNHRYFYKRAQYLAEIAAILKRTDNGLYVDLTFEYLQHDHRRPVLILTSQPTGKDTDFSKLNCRIRIFPMLSKDVFSLRKLAPGRNAVRPQSVGLSEQDTAKPTPRYNASLLSDIMYRDHMVYIYRQVRQCPGFVDACLLGRTWLQQRGFGRGGRVFNGFLWSILLAFLITKGHGDVKLATGFSSYQLFKGTIDFLAKHDFEKNPISMCDTEHEGVSIGGISILSI
jgi:U3 small nucleolar RNA-associated protein 22